jgi:hypothetical protein
LRGCAANHQWRIDLVSWNACVERKLVRHDEALAATPRLETRSRFDCRGAVGRPILAGCATVARWRTAMAKGQKRSNREPKKPRPTRRRRPAPSRARPPSRSPAQRQPVARNRRRIAERVSGPNGASRDLACGESIEASRSLLRSGGVTRPDIRARLDRCRV